MDLKIKDVAELLSVSETTIRRWVNDGKIPAYRLQQQYRFSRSEIENWMVSCRLQSKGNFLPGEEKQIYSDNKGIQHYKVREWNEAIDCFEECLNTIPEDPPSVEYRSRCIEYKFNSPGKDWDGITVMTEK